MTALEAGVAERLGGVRAVLLDMDGTLVDSDEAVERAWRTWAAAYGADLEAVRPLMHGRPADATIRSVRPDLDDVAVAEAAAHQLALQYDDLSDVVALPGAHALLDTITDLGLPWAVVTSADRPLAAARLGAAGIAPPHLITVEDVEHGKPDPEGFLLAARSVGIPPTRCLVVEDSAAGVEAGRAAGAVTAALRGLPGDVTVRDLVELAVLLVRVPRTPSS